MTQNAEPAPTVASEARRYIGTRVRKRFGRHGMFEGTVTAAAGRLLIDGKERRELHLHVKYDDGDEEDITWETFTAIQVKETRSEEPTRHNIKRPACYEEDAAEEDAAPAAVPAAAPARAWSPATEPATWQPAAVHSQPAAAAAASQPAAVAEQPSPARASAEKENTAAAAARRAPVKSGLEEADAFAAPAPKRQKRAAGGGGGLQNRGPKERVDDSLRIMMPPNSNEPQPMDAEVGDGFRMRTRGLAGHLHRVTVTNFMCHGHFTMDFGPHVTFISGTNGSGKSAVLQAVQFCLGVSAAKTGRAGSIQNFIKSGCHEAKVAVTLWNTGEDAYRPDAYGQFITIQRKAGSGSGYQLSGERGNIVSRSRDEMLEVIDHLSIDAANPIAVMTQDCARDFLSGSGEASDKKKHELFMQATSLAKVQTDLATAEAYIGQQGDVIEAEKPKLKKLRQEAKELTDSIERLKEVETWRVQSQQITYALAWAQVEEVAEHIATAEEKLARLAAMGAEQLDAALDALMAEINAQELEVEAQKAAMESFNEDVSNLTDEASALQSEHVKARRACSRIASQIRKLKDNLQMVESQKQQLDETLAESQAEWGAANAEYNANVQALQSRADTLQQRGDQLQAAAREAGDQFTEAVDAEHEAKRALHQRKCQAENARRQKQQAQQHRGAAAAQFGGAAMVELCNRVQGASGRFHRQPIGPIGAVLSLTDVRWNKAVDAAMGNHLSNFIVHDAHDMQLLRGLGRQAGLGSRLSISVMDYDIRRHEMPPPQLLTLLQALSCDHERRDTVLNVLIDQMKCEKTVLCETSQDAQHAIHAPNVNAVYTADGSKRYKKFSTLGYIPYRPPHYRRGMLGQDASAYLKQLDEDLAAAQLEVLSAEQEAAQLLRASHEAKRRMHDERRRFYDSRKEQDTARNDLDLALSQPPPPSQPLAAAEGNDDAEGDSLQADIAEKTNEIYDLRQSLVADEAKAREAVARECAADAEHQAKKAEIEEVKAANERRLAEMSSRLEALRRKEEQCESLAANRHQITALQEEWEAVLEEKRKQHTKSSALAAKVCEREAGLQALEEVEAGAQRGDLPVPLPVSPLGLSAARQKLERRMNAQLKEAGGSVPELELQLQRVLRRQTDLRKRMANVVEAYNVAVEGFEARTKAVAEKTKMITARVKNSFAEHMGRKGHLGSISLKDGKLEIKVQIAGSSDRGGKGKGGQWGTKDVKQLSGGERSFTTVALTLAIGEWANCPFRALDEFDVFADSVTRTVSLASLFGFARHCHELQMILITPQDVAAVEEAKKMLQTNENIESIDRRFVHVVRMAPARANAVHS